MSGDDTPATLEQQSSTFTKSKTDGSEDAKSPYTPDRVESMEKTELVETDKAPKTPMEERIFSIVASMAKTAAMKTIKEELELYQGLIEDAKSTDERLKIIREVSDLKLRATGTVMAAMLKGGAFRLPGQALPKDPNLV